MIIKSAHGHDVEVTHNIYKKGHSHVIELTATCENATQKKNITLGAEDGPKPQIPPEILPQILQQTLDEHRQLLADDISWNTHIENAVKDLK